MKRYLRYLRNLYNSAPTIVVVILVIVVIIALFCFVPMLFLWSVNSLAASGGSTFYIAHSLWNYWVSLILLLCLGVRVRVNA